MLVDKQRPVPHDLLRDLCELAQWAPNHKRTWPWRFAAFSGSGRSKLGAAFAAIIWAFSQLLGLPDMAMYVLMALGLIPVIWSTIWVAGRAWHVEQLLETGRDVDRPVFKALYYFKKH